MSMLNIYFSYAQDEELYRTSSGASNLFVDKIQRWAGVGVGAAAYPRNRRQRGSSNSTRCRTTGPRSSEAVQHSIAQEFVETPDPVTTLTLRPPATLVGRRESVELTRRARPGLRPSLFSDVHPSASSRFAVSRGACVSATPASGQPRANGRMVSKEGSKSYQEPDDSSIEHTGRADPHVPVTLLVLKRAGKLCQPNQSVQIRRRGSHRSLAAFWLLGYLRCDCDVRIRLERPQRCYQEYSTASGRKPLQTLLRSLSVASWALHRSRRPMFQPPGGRA